MRTLLLLLVLGLAVIAGLSRAARPSPPPPTRHFTITPDEFSRLSPEEQDDPYILMHLEAGGPTSP
jgi:hypothetical protein